MTDDRSVLTNAAGTRGAVAISLAQAFQNDPVFRWLLPDDDARRAKLPKLFDLLFEIEQPIGDIRTSPAAEAASFWRPPGRAVTPFVEILKRALPLWGIFGFGLARMSAVTKAIEAHLPKDGAFWYAHFVGVRPDAQGRGWGRAMMRAGMARAAADGLPVYLETARPENVSFYSGLGFEVLGEWDVPGGPRFWSMIRRAD